VSPRIPVLLVSGFLGSGKTTLVRHLLADAQKRGVRTAVVTNELGALGIDRALLAAAPDAVELSGGCICCRLSDDFVTTLERLRERASPERVIVETSGVALPYDAQLHLWREPVSRWLGDDVVVVMVNAERFARGLDAGEVFAQQVSSADLLVLNQLDRVPASDLPRLESELRALEPDAPILRAVHAQVAPELLFPPDPQRLRAARRTASAPHPPHTHEEFQAEEIALPEGRTSSELLAFLRSLGALRLKGFAQTREGLRIVQGIGSRIELVPADAPSPPVLVNRAVVIRRR
jgi:cobalamin biosynthesis protein CobW